jgi:hypothetical protein
MKKPVRRRKRLRHLIVVLMCQCGADAFVCQPSADADFFTGSEGVPVGLLPTNPDEGADVAYALLRAAFTLV